jgi:transcriptional regulator with XRE-family HTH domain
MESTTKAAPKTIPLKKACQAYPNHLLRKARQDRGWSQQKVAELIEAPQSFLVSRWEGGRAIPSPIYREKLCLLFGKSSQELGLLTPPRSACHSQEHTTGYDPIIPPVSLNTSRLIGRDRLLGQLKESLLYPTAHSVTALSGLPGIGKTALAAALATDPDIQQHFAGGILWTGLGPSPQWHSLFAHWSNLLGVPQAKPSSLISGEMYLQALRTAIGSRRMLLIIDDAWNREDVLTCMIGGPYCTYLLTTRIPYVATYFARQQAFQVPVLPGEESIQLLIHQVPALVHVEQEQTKPLVQAAGGLPLALILISNYLLLHASPHQPRRLQNAISKLQQVKERLQISYPQAGLYRDQRLSAGTALTLQTIIDISIAKLDKTARQVFFALSAFPPNPYSFSEEAALAVTGTTIETLDLLVDNGLLEVSGSGRYLMHQTLTDYARLQRTTTLAEKRLITYVVTYLEQHLQGKRKLEQEQYLILYALPLALQLDCQTEFVRCISALTPSLCTKGWFPLIEMFLQEMWHIAHNIEEYHRSLTLILIFLNTYLREQNVPDSAEAILQKIQVTAHPVQPLENKEPTSET